MSSAVLQIPTSRLQLDDPKSPKSPTSPLSLSPTEKDSLKLQSIVDSHIVLNVQDFDSPVNTPKASPRASISIMDSARKPRAVIVKTTPPPPQTASIQPQLRKSFMRKVLAILVLQLIITGAIIGITFIPDIGIRDFMATNLPLLILMAVLSLGSLCFLMCKRNACRKVPKNYILLFSYTIGTSYLLGSLAAMTESNIVLFAGAATALVVLAIAIYACFTKTDLTPRGMGITTLMATASILILAGFLLEGRIVSILLSGVVALAFGLHLTFNIQKLTGKYESKYSLDDYIIASLDMYVDIIQIFAAFLTLFRRG